MLQQDTIKMATEMDTGELETRSCILFMENEHKEALAHLQLALSQDVPLERKVIMEIRMAEILDILGREKEALEELRRTYPSLKSVSPSSKIMFYIALAKHYLHCPFLAIRHLETAFSIAEQNGFGHQLNEISFMIAEISA